MIDLSDRAALRPLARLLTVVQESAGNTRFLLIGAAARDILLVHWQGVAVQRATEDTDLALAVADWDTFLRVRQSLIARGATAAEELAHRLWLGDQRLDLIPFGGVEGPDRSIAWPPGHTEVMDVSGLREAQATAVSVRLPGGVAVPVATLPALAVLKVWAWNDRKYTAPGKDAVDLWLFLGHYADAGNEERLYGPEGDAALASLGFDLEKAGAWLLGRDARNVLAHGTDAGRSLESLDRILRPEIDPLGSLQLVGQMPHGDRDRQVSALAAFHAGLTSDSRRPYPG